MQRTFLRERLVPNVIGWRSHRGWCQVDNLHYGAPEFVAEAEKHHNHLRVSTHFYNNEAGIERLARELASTL
jgi:selenocysteine lyase/cysteine desulfurase